MKFRKPWAILFLMGLAIHVLSVPPAPITASVVHATETRDPAGRGSLPSVSQESESIDSFNVHPANRWSEGTSGTFAEDLENGEFSIDGFENTSSSNLRYRDAETTSGDIEVRWRLNASDSDAGGVNGSDFETVLMGLNVTTDEGSGNSSLNAYYYNSTHYTLRPTFTTSDGVGWRSWNIESDWQDFFQMNGSWGADGIDFIEEGFDGITARLPGAIISEKGIVIMTTGVGATSGINHVSFGVQSTDSFAHISTKVKINDTVNNYTFSVGKAGVATHNSLQFIPTGNWQILNLNVTSGNTIDFIRVIKTNHATIANISMDWLLWTSNNDSSDLTFFEYETYYRGKMKYDLMESSLNWKISDDSDNKLTSTVQGSFAIEDFFEPDELIRDIHQGAVGEIDYFFGLRSAGANATTWWDFYLADFQEFAWKRDSSLTSADIDDWFSATSVYASNYKGNTTLSNDKLVTNTITVPEFDSASGTFSIQETNASTSHAIAEIEIASVNPSDGVTTNEIAISIGDGSIPFLDGFILTAPGNTHHIQVHDGSAPLVATTDWDTTFTNHSEVAFSFFFNKIERKISLQLEFINGSEIRRFAYDVDVDASLSDEFVIRVAYLSGNSAAGVQEVVFQLDEWDLVFRDIFGIPLPLPDVPQIDLPSPPKDPIGFLIQAFRDLAGIMQGSLDEILAQGSTLTQILTNIVTIATNSITMAASLASLVTDIAQVLLDLDSLITNTGGLVADFTTLLADFTTLLADTSSMVTDLTQMVTDFSTLLADTSNMVTDLGSIVTGVSDLPADFIDLLSDTANMLTNLEDVFDALVDVLGDSWLGQIFAELVALAVSVGTAIFDEFISRALAIMTDVYTGLLDFIRSITVSGVSIGDVIDFIDSWMVNFWNIADSIISLGTEILTVWTQVFLMGLLGIILIWAAASANGDGALFTERFTTAMNYDVNPIGFILTIRIPLGVILLGNLFFVVFAAYDWQAFLVPGVVIAGFQLGAAYETPDYSDQMDDFFEFTTSILEDILDTLLDEVAGTAWKTLVTLLSDDILGAAPEIIVFVVTAGIAASILLRGRF